MKLQVVRGYCLCIPAIVALWGVDVSIAEQPPITNDLVELAWAYAIETDPPPPLKNNGEKYTLPDTPLTFTLNEIYGWDPIEQQLSGAPADWYPADHPPMPDIVAKGAYERKVIPCALCHYPNGKGKAENANPAGLPKEYLVHR